MQLKQNTKIKKLAPIALFTYKKLEPLKLTISALQSNQFARESDLIIFSDAALNSQDEIAVNSVREYLKTVSGFKTINIRQAKSNNGLAKSIITGVTKLLSKSESVIVMEDDLITSPNFLEYMNGALHFYNNHPNIFSISGYTPSIQAPEDYKYDVYFTMRASSWGWGTWRNHWENVDWNISNYEVFKKNRVAQIRFNRMGSDMTNMLTKQQNGKLDSWAIRWCFHQFQHQLYSVYPIKSKIQNIGFVEFATHTKSKNMDKRFFTCLDKGIGSNYLFAPKAEILPVLIKQFLVPYSLRTRLFYKIKNLLSF